LATSLFGFLAPFSAIIGAITMQMSKLNVEVAEEVETKKELNDLNLPIGWKVDRIRYKASMPGQPPILDEESSTTAKDDLETEYKWLTELLNGAGSGITEFANTIMAFIGEIGAAWETIYPQIFGLIDAVLETMMAGLRPLKDWIIAELIPSIGNLAEGFTKFWKDQIDPFLRDKVFPKIAEWGLKLYSFFKDKFVPFLETKLWPFISGPLWDMFSTAIDNVIIALTGLFDALVYYWDVVETVLLNALDQWVSQMFGFTEGLTIGMAVLNEFNAAMGEQGSSLDAFYDKMWGLGHSVEEVNRAMMLMAQDPSWSGIHAAADSLGMDVYDLSDLFRSMGIDITALAQRLNEAKDTIPDFTVNENTPPPGGGTSGGENPGGGSGDGTLWGGLARIGYMTSGGSSMTFKDLFMAAGFSAGAAQATYTSLKGNGMSEYDVFQYINSRYVPNLDIGGSVTSSGIASVKQGEVWYNPAVGRPYGMDNNGMIVNTAVYMNGEEIVRQTDNYKSGQNALTSGTALPGGL